MGAMATTAPTAPTGTMMGLMRALTTTRRSRMTVRVVSRTAQLAKCGGSARAIPMAHLLGGSRASAAPRAATEFVASRVYLATTGLDGWTDDGAHDSNWQDDGAHGSDWTQSWFFRWLCLPSLSLKHSWLRHNTVLVKKKRPREKKKKKKKKKKS